MAQKFTDGEIEIFARQSIENPDAWAVFSKALSPSDNERVSEMRTALAQESAVVDLSEQFTDSVRDNSVQAMTVATEMFTTLSDLAVTIADNTPADEKNKRGAPSKKGTPRSKVTEHVVKAQVNPTTLVKVVVSYDSPTEPAK